MQSLCAPLILLLDYCPPSANTSCLLLCPPPPLHSPPPIPHEFSYCQFYFGVFVYWVLIWAMLALQCWCFMKTTLLWLGYMCVHAYNNLKVQDYSVWWFWFCSQVLRVGKYLCLVFLPKAQMWRYKTLWKVKSCSLTHGINIVSFTLITIFIWVPFQAASFLFFCGQLS